jgi:hypothetical protein
MMYEHEMACGVAAASTRRAEGSTSRPNVYLYLEHPQKDTARGGRRQAIWPAVDCSLGESRLADY